MSREKGRCRMEELTIKFGKGFAEPFTGKDGKKYMQIRIPNEDPGDHSPWASFVLPEKAVHENQFGKGLWAKITADGSTTVTKPERAEGADGGIVWENRKISVSNTELKSMVEAYKNRDPQMREPKESVCGRLDTMVRETADKLKPEKGSRPKVKSSGMEK